MGMYTELVIAFELKEGTPVDVVRVLSAMCSAQPGVILHDGINHPLFQTYRWHWMLRSGSYYFSGDPHSTVRYDEIARTHFCTIRCNFKNYNNELDLFLDWITPYIENPVGEFLGYARYEEDDHPTLLYNPPEYIKGPDEWSG